MVKQKNLGTLGLILWLCFCAGCSFTRQAHAKSDVNLEVVVGDPITFNIRETKNGELAHCFRDGTVYVGLNHMVGAGPHGFRSTDGGKTWEAAPYSGTVMGQTSDGTIMAFEQLTYKKGPGEFIGKVRFSKDGYKTIDGPRDIPLHIPKGTGGIGDDLKDFEGPIFWGAMIELPSGDLLVTMYGYFEGDNTPIELPPDNPLYNNPRFAKYRTIVLRSQDHGNSWSYLSTVAYDPKIGQEGYCEPAMALLPDGRLLCVMRTGYNKDPMYQAWSKDNGQTWSKPVSIGFRGVDPALTVLSDGMVACSYGVKGHIKGMRRERNVIFSVDGGATWSHPTEIYGGPGGSYPGLCAIRPGELLFVYEAQALPERFNEPSPHRFRTMGAVISVKKM